MVLLICAFGDHEAVVLKRPRKETPSMANTKKHDFSVVAVDKFIQATRDSGYRGTSNAVAELVDNSLQAGATSVSILLSVDRSNVDEHTITLTVVDNGSGMNSHTLRTALRFGGSTRFGDRSGLGRYGMGLPNSSLSQARRVEVYSWSSLKGKVRWSYIDLDEIVAGVLTEVPRPKLIKRPHFINGYKSGTAVEWSRCDRFENKRVSTISRKLVASLGQKFRHFLWNGISIQVNGEKVLPIDPLFLHPKSVYSGATEFCDEQVYEISANQEKSSKVGLIRVRFSELPVAVWSKLTNKEKQQRGISKGAGVSIVRANREVSYGWYFFGGKRRENYDDWWRCEISFDPVLDEAFGITHTKQQVRPLPHLIEALSPDMEAIARALNGRARKAHRSVKESEYFSASEALANKKDHLLLPLPIKQRPRDKKILKSLTIIQSYIKGSSDHYELDGKYRIISDTLSETSFYNYARDNGRLVLIINPEHPFYKMVYKPLLESDCADDMAMRSKFDLLLLSAARAEAIINDTHGVKFAEKFRSQWSDTLATFLSR